MGAQILVVDDDPMITDVLTRFLSRELIVPMIYFDVRWPGKTVTKELDVLAIDRAGSGSHEDNGPWPSIPRR